MSNIKSIKDLASSKAGKMKYLDVILDRYNELVEIKNTTVYGQSDKVEFDYLCNQINRYKDQAELLAIELDIPIHNSQNRP